jgi:hypothetical protein
MRITLSEYHSVSGPTLTPAQPVTAAVVGERAAIGSLIGIIGGLALALPVVIYDWASSTHSVWELPMAATAWMFGMSHFEANGFDAWSALIGVLLLAAYAIASGAVFEYLADRVMRLRNTVDTMAAGLGFGLVSFLFFWYTLLPIARDGVPFHELVLPLTLPLFGTAVISVAPFWVFVLGFALLGLATSFAYRSLRRT